MEKMQFVGAAAIDTFAVSAEPGERMTYYRGDLAYDVAHAKMEDVRAVKEARATAWMHAKAGRLHLFQERVGRTGNDFNYIAVKAAPMRGAIHAKRNAAA